MDTATPVIVHTDDLSLVAALAMQGIHPIDTAVLGRKHSYSYESTAYFREVLAAYDRGTLIGSIKQFALVYRDLVAQMRRHQQMMQPIVAAAGPRQ